MSAATTGPHARLAGVFADLTVAHLHPGQAGKVTRWDDPVTGLTHLGRPDRDRHVRVAADSFDRVRWQLSVDGRPRMVTRWETPDGSGPRLAAGHLYAADGHAHPAVMPDGPGPVVRVAVGRASSLPGADVRVESAGDAAWAEVRLPGDVVVEVDVGPGTVGWCVTRQGRVSARQACTPLVPVALADLDAHLSDVGPDPQPEPRRRPLWPAARA